MGIHATTLDFFWETIGKDTSLKDKWLLELGNQAMRNDTKKAYGFKSGKSKVYFLGFRCNHHAIDWNGLDGAVPLDMTKPIPIERFMDAFEIVTDFGCLEHIFGDKKYKYINQWQAWNNIHDMGKVGCIYIHTVPLWGSHRGHGKFKYTLRFFEDICKVNGYKPIISKIVKHNNRGSRDYVYSSYVKMIEKPFAPDLKTFEGFFHG